MKATLTFTEGAMRLTVEAETEGEKRMIAAAEGYELNPRIEVDQIYSHQIRGASLVLSGERKPPNPQTGEL